MGYRTGPTKESEKGIAALQYALPYDARRVLKSSIKWNEDEDKKDPTPTLKKLWEYHAGTKNIIHERVIFNRLRSSDNDTMNQWEVQCRDQGTKCEYCVVCTPQLISDRFIVGINDDILMSKLVNSGVKNKNVTLEEVVLQAQQYDSICCNASLS